VRRHRLNDVLPFDSDSEETTLVAGVTHVDDIAAQVEHQSNGDVISWQADSSDPTSEEISDVIGQAAGADRTLF
jgi:beta-N-acetylhexosaminidase